MKQEYRFELTVLIGTGAMGLFLIVAQGLA